MMPVYGATKTIRSSPKNDNGRLTRCCFFYHLSMFAWVHGEGLTVYASIFLDGTVLQKVVCSRTMGCLPGATQAYSAATVRGLSNEHGSHDLCKLWTATIMTRGECVRIAGHLYASDTDCPVLLDSASTE